MSEDDLELVIASENADARRRDAAAAGTLSHMEADMEAYADEVRECFDDGYRAGVSRSLEIVRSSKMGHPLVVAQLSLIEDALNSLLLPNPEPKRISP